ncbi:MAG: hypothetical protein LBL44_02635 [Treponema sp.]|nr:hypothetical protein [Treponema sp.]
MVHVVRGCFEFEIPPAKQGALKKKFTSKSKKSKKEEKKGLESKNLFDFFDLAVKILPKLGNFHGAILNSTTDRTDKTDKHGLLISNVYLVRVGPCRPWLF